MRLRSTAAVLLALGLVLSVGACGGDREDSADGVEASEPQAPLTQAQLDASLLTLEDMPTGWSLGEWTPGDDSTPDFEPAECGKRFRDNVEGEDDPLRESGVAFANDGATPVEFEMEVSAYEEPFDRTELAEFDDFFEDCPNLTTVIEGEEAEVRVRALSFPQLGDASRALRLSISLPGVAVTSDLVLVALGHNTVSFGTVGLGNATLEGEEFEALVRKGLANVESASA